MKMFKQKETTIYPRRVRKNPAHRKYLSDWQAQKRDNLKCAVVNVLTDGEGTCRSCGQGDIDVLNVDHIDNDGKEHRKIVPTSNILRWLIQNDYPPGFQILCANCNLKKEVTRRRQERELRAY
jgi:hypothetical protein